jgi:hypothetical protein
MILTLGCNDAFSDGDADGPRELRKERTWD